MSELDICTRFKWVFISTYINKGIGKVPVLTEIGVYVQVSTYKTWNSPACGYFLDQTKIILVISARNVPWDKKCFDRMRLKVLTGSLYLGRFLGDTKL